MKKVYSIEGDKIVIRVPRFSFRYLIDEEEGGEPVVMDNVVAVYYDEYENGLCYRIDMDYKGKPDQWSDFFFKLDGTKEEFENMVNDLKIEAVYIKK